MQAVILAAGKGTRMRELTQTTPKPLLEIQGKSLIEHKIDQLPEDIEEVVIVVGYLENTIRDALGDNYTDKKITYVTQTELNGTAGALWAAQDVLHNRFLVMMGDDLYRKDDIQNLLVHDWSLGVHILRTRDGKQLCGSHVEQDEKGHFTGISGDTRCGDTRALCAGIYVLGHEIFSYTPVTRDGKEGELSLPHTLIQAAPDYDMYITELTNWLQVTSPEDLPKAKEWLGSN